MVCLGLSADSLMGFSTVSAMGIGFHTVLAILPVLIFRMVSDIKRPNFRESLTLISHLNSDWEGIVLLQSG